MSAGPALEARDLTVRLGGRVALERASVALAGGALTAVIGPNGAGKSTLLRALCGLVPAASGHVACRGRPLSAMTRPEIAREVAFLPQERQIHWPMSVRRIVALGRLPLRRSGMGAAAADVEAVEAAMRVLDLAALADRPVDRLSGGERARVLLARALAQETPVLLADEPAASLDPAHQIALFERLAALAEAGRTIAVAVHDLSLALRFCSEAILVCDGRIVAAGPTGDVMTPARLGAAFGLELRRGEVDGVPVIVAR